MARINVDECALSDPRFDVLATMMGSDDPDLARGKMIRVWMQCANREVYVLSAEIINVIFKNPDAAEWLIRAQLAEKVKTGYRIRGTKDRTDYVKRLRSNGRQYGHLGAEHGRKGGRPKKTPSEGFENPQERVTENPPLALTLSPALAPAQEDGAAADFESFWNAYPNKARKEFARREWDCLPITPQLVSEIMAGLTRWQQSGQWAKDGGQYIPQPANWLREKRWLETPLAHSATPRHSTNGKPTIAEHIAMRQREKEQAGQ